MLPSGFGEALAFAFPAGATGLTCGNGHWSPRLQPGSFPKNRHGGLCFNEQELPALHFPFRCNRHTPLRGFSPSGLESPPAEVPFLPLSPLPFPPLQTFATFATALDGCNRCMGILNMRLHLLLVGLESATFYNSTGGPLSHV